MRLYVVIVDDKHTDTDVALFSDVDKAIRYAHQTAEEYGYEKRDPEYWAQEATPPVGFLYHAVSPASESSLWVVVRDLDGEAE